MTIKDLTKDEYFNYYQTYIAKVKEHDLVEGLVQNKMETVSLLESLSEEKFDYAYDIDKWTIKELLLHIIDTERIFANRALRIARNDQVHLPGFDQDEFNNYAEANSRTKTDLIEDFIAARNNTIALFKSFSESMLTNIGIASDHKLSTRAAGFIIIGHENHHIEILRERYL
ncbi:DinB family protein [Urechidicola vernalis]|uniref:DinB family protein n=1 Tax=Urechidicola vernalis TaxID=3075600 RepID=A0ABU2Y7C2_9FLAO|nr:DinB family protein [Urechidicola sp. P050]MDT0553592.1 DinB family protein [Urechidicola sp. P050]